MNRRDFFLLKDPDQGIYELSCEKLYMRYLDSQLDGTQEQLFERTRETLRNSSKILLKDASWLNRGELKLVLEPMLEEFQETGGHIEYL
ncbi:MAG: hypothetical protein V3R94_03070 [Acidobacteriota bacterium]